MLLEKGYGFADLARRIPVDPERTLFRAGSVSKLFTWTAVMQQVEQGKIDLDRDINAYLDFTIPPREGKPVTRGWSALLVIACLTTLWIALTFKLIAFSVNY